MYYVLSSNGWQFHTTCNILRMSLLQSGRIYVCLQYSTANNAHGMLFLPFLRFLHMYMQWHVRYRPRLLVGYAPRLRLGITAIGEYKASCPNLRLRCGLSYKCTYCRLGVYPWSLYPHVIAAIYIVSFFRSRGVKSIYHCVGWAIDIALVYYIVVQYRTVLPSNSSNNKLVLSYYWPHTRPTRCDMKIYFISKASRIVLREDSEVSQYSTVLYHDAFRCINFIIATTITC